MMVFPPIGEDGWSFSVNEAVWLGPDRPEMPREALEAKLRAAMAQIEPGAHKPDVRFDAEYGQYVMRARRVFAGRPVDGGTYAALNLYTGRLVEYSPGFRSVEPEAYGAAPILPVERLRDAAYGAYMRLRPFDEAEVDTEEVVIARPGVRPDSALRARYAAVLDKGIPTYRMRWMHATHSYVDVQVDARDGTVLWSFRAEAMGGGDAGPPAPFPSRISASGREGALERLRMTSFTPPGRLVAVRSGRSAYAAYFEPGQGTLWIRRRASEPYRAFRPDPALLSAMRREKPPKPFGRKG